MSALALTLALLVGLLLGVLGGGGSVLAVPIFLYVAGYPAPVAAAASLLVVGLVSLLGAFRHYRTGTLRLSVAAPFAVSSTIGSYAGARLAPVLGPDLQLTLLGLLMLAGAAAMRKSAGKIEQDGTSSMLAVTVRGLAVGVLTGIVGVGGGFMIVPALLAGSARLTMREAVATSLAVIALNCFGGLAGYLGAIRLPWVAVLQFLGAALAGMMVGLHASQRIPASLVKRFLSLLLLLIGSWTLVHTWLLKGA